MLEALLPKKFPFKIAKCQDHLNFVLNNDNEVVFFNQRDGPYYPTLKTLHKAGNFMAKIHVDQGAIKHIINGADVMCGGIRTAKSSNIGKDTPVLIIAEGKQLPLGVGVTKMSVDDISSINKGIGVESIHVLGDGLWTIKSID